jgi:hypothetical protein
MGKLDPGARAVIGYKPGNSAELGYVLVLPYAQISAGDPAFGQDRRGLGHDQTGSSHGTRSEMYEMPVGCETILARVLAHGRHEYPVAEGGSANVERFK